MPNKNIDKNDGILEDLNNDVIDSKNILGRDDSAKVDAENIDEVVNDSTEVDIEDTLEVNNSTEVDIEEIDEVVNEEVECDCLNIPKSDSECEYVEEEVIKRKNSGLLKIGAVALASSILGSVATMFIMKDVIGQTTSGPIVVENVESKGMQGLNVYQAVTKKASPSVVGIMTTTINTDNIFSIPVENSGIGTGVIVDSRGYILTNAHVISTQGSINVVLNNGKNMAGSVLWQDSNLDLAVVKIDGDGYVAAELGDSDKVSVGDISVAIGNPIGMEFQATVTQGIISGVNRSVEGSNFAMEGLIQTDASINPGNSGGPLLNDKGQVIGINTAKTVNTEGIGFAIPINIAKPIVEQVIKTGSFEKVMLGIKGMALSTFESLVGADLEADKGVYIVEVQENTPAKIAGIKTGDVIVSINGAQVSDMNSLAKELYKIKFGETCEVIVNRSGEDVVLKVKFKKN